MGVSPAAQASRKLSDLERPGRVSASPGQGRRRTAVVSSTRLAGASPPCVSLGSPSLCVVWAHVTLSQLSLWSGVDGPGHTHS